MVKVKVGQSAGFDFEDRSQRVLATSYQGNCKIEASLLPLRARISSLVAICAVTRFSHPQGQLNLWRVGDSVLLEYYLELH